MSDFVFVSEDEDVWYMTPQGKWVVHDGGEPVTLDDLLALYSGVVYEAVADLSKLPNPEPKDIGAVHDTEHATYIRFTSEDLTDPWICTRTGVRFSWHHIQ